jgi:hypothetical protein
MNNVSFAGLRKFNSVIVRSLIESSECAFKKTHLSWHRKKPDRDGRLNGCAFPRCVLHPEVLMHDGDD